MCIHSTVRPPQRRAHDAFGIDGGLQLTAEGGFLPEMIKAVLERGLKAELTEQLGYQHGCLPGPLESAVREVSDMPDV
jgi:hypothetical protein